MTLRIDKKLSADAVGWSITTTLALTAIFGYRHAGDGPWTPLAGVILSVAVGLVVRLMMRRRLWAWLVVFVAGIFGGWLSAVQLLSGEPFEQELFVSTVTLAFFGVLGLSLGALAEFVRLVHFLLHGGRVWDYPQRPATVADVDKNAPKP